MWRGVVKIGYNLSMKKKFFIQVKADFLLNIYDDLLSSSPWLYIYLKFKQDYFPNKFKKNQIFFNSVELSKNLNTTQFLIWKTARNLIEKGLMAKLDNKCYMMFPEKNYLEKISKTHIKSYDTKQAFFQISYDFFNKYWNNINLRLPMKIYYYLLMKNNHFLFYNKIDKQLVTDNGITLTSLWKELKIHRKTMLKYLDYLKKIGLIEYEDNQIYTLSENYIMRKSI